MSRTYTHVGIDSDEIHIKTFTIATSVGVNRCHRQQWKSSNKLKIS